MIKKLKSFPYEEKKTTHIDKEEITKINELVEKDFYFNG